MRRTQNISLKVRLQVDENGVSFRSAATSGLNRVFPSGRVAPPTRRQAGEHPMLTAARLAFL